MNRRLRSQAGLTLIEVMLAGFFAMTVVLGIASFQAAIGKFFRQGSERVRLQQNVHRASQVMAVGVRKAHEFRIYDPANPNADPNVKLVTGPAVRLLNADGGVIEDYRRSDEAYVVNLAGERLDDMKVANLGFEADPEGPLVIALALEDRYGHQSEIRTEVSPRAPGN